MTEIDLDNLIRVTKIITNIIGTHTIDYTHISAALKILAPNISKYSSSAYETWIEYQKTKVTNYYFKKSKGMLNEDNYRVKNDAAAYLSGIIIVHDDYLL